MTLVAPRKRPDSSLDMTPLIDVVFQLLIFLLVSTTFVKREAVVDLPSGQSTEANQPLPDREALSIAILADGSLMAGDIAVDLDAIPARIQSHLAEGQLNRVEIRGDRSSHFGIFVGLLEAVRGEGIESIAIVKELEADDANR